MITNPSGEIAITGGSGYLARAILTVAQKEQWDAQFTILSRDEAKQRRVKERFSQVRCVIGDVRDSESLERVFWGKDLVIHAAALKMIPQAESDPNEAIAINVFGSQNVARAAVKANVPKVLGISTDKVVSPINTYGMTKALMERIFTDYNKYVRTHFALVRYGNVVGSTGSVIPLFQQQYKDGKTLTVTDPTMTRFWLSYQEAVETIKMGLDAPRFCNIIPKCRAMTMFSLAKTINESEDMSIIGPRPGEKRHEELLGALESYNAEDVGGYFRLRMVHPTEEQQFLYAYDEPRGAPLTEGYFYRSDLAETLAPDEMRKMIADSEAV